MDSVHGDSVFIGFFHRESDSHGCGFSHGLGFPHRFGFFAGCHIDWMSQRFGFTEFCIAHGFVFFTGFGFSQRFGFHRDLVLIGFGFH